MASPSSTNTRATMSQTAIASNPANGGRFATQAETPAQPNVTYSAPGAIVRPYKHQEASAEDNEQHPTWYTVPRPWSLGDGNNASMASHGEAVHHNNTKEQMKRWMVEPAKHGPYHNIEAVKATAPKTDNKVVAHKEDVAEDNENQNAEWQDVVYENEDDVAAEDWVLLDM